MRSWLLPLSVALLLPVPASAASSASIADALSDKQAVPPAVIFVVDLSPSMGTACFSGSTNTCLADTVDVIKQVTRHFDDVRYGVVATADSSSTDEFVQVAPVGSSYADVTTALDALVVNTGTTRNLGEVLDTLSTGYLSQSDAEDFVDDDGDGFDGDWDESPFSYYCSDVHVIVMSMGRPVDDSGPSGAAGGSTVSPADVVCDSSGLSSTEAECYFDNVVNHLYYLDHSSLTGDQNVLVSTIGLGLDLSDTDEAIADALFSSASDTTSGEAMYTAADSKDEALSGVVSILSDVMSGRFSRSDPIIAQDGSYLLYTYYELTGDHPLAEGHILGYEIDTDPESSTYGEIIYYAGAPYDDYYGAVWDGGWLLYSRIANTAEINQDDMDGFNERDIYFYDSTVASYMPGDRANRRLSFDYDFVSTASANSLVSMFLDDTMSGSTPASPQYDLNRDDTVDGDDLQSLVDFTRGVAETKFRYLDLEHGRWKLQDSPYSSPVVVTRRSDTYANSTSYRTFLDLIEAEEMPDIVLLAANDGLLHAFALSDDEATPTVDEGGEELWAWVPNALLLDDRATAWSNGLIDMMLYGRTFLFDGTPVVEDVWIDADNDGVKDCGADLDDCEWRRVVVVQQGFGGATTLALDITYTDTPQFLWEQTNKTDETAMGYTTSRPTVFNVYDTSTSSSPTDRWVAMWGGGRGANYSEGSTDYFSSVEASLYVWAVGDDVFTGGSSAAGYSDAGDNIGSEHPDYSAHSSTLSLDSDSNLEYTYISAPPAVVDVDADGDADVAYFPVTMGYDPSTGVTADADPGHSVIYKALLSSTDVDNLTWCQFYDPSTGAEPTSASDTGSSGSGPVAYGSRPEVYYALTTSWLKNGALGVYWGTGSPFQANDQSVTDGALFFMKDPSPESCSTAQALTCGSETGGFYSLAAGERLTADPVIYAGVVYFSTYTPDTDVCTMGQGRIYGLDYEDCGPGIDTNGDGAATSADDDALLVDGYPSRVTVGDNGKLYYASGTDVAHFDAVTDPFAGTAMVGWMEMY